MSARNLRGRSIVTLSVAERLRTSDDLISNLALSELEFTPDRLPFAVDAGAVSGPVDVWQLRDYLEKAARAANAAICSMRHSPGI